MITLCLRSARRQCPGLLFEVQFVRRHANYFAATLKRDQTKLDGAGQGSRDAEFIAIGGALARRSPRGLCSRPERLELGV